jgi:hypothetical protein
MRPYIETQRCIGADFPGLVDGVIVTAAHISDKANPW